MKVRIIDLSNPESSNAMHPLLNIVQGFLAESINGNKHTQQAWAMFAFGFVSRTLHEISDEKWEQIKNEKIEACDNPGCKCHLIEAELIQAFDKVRTFSQQAHKEKSEKKDSLHSQRN